MKSFSKTISSDKETRDNTENDDSDNPKIKYLKVYEKNRKIRDEILFCSNMLLTYISIAVIFAKPTWFPKINSISVIILMIHRIYEFSYYKWQFYLIDFCYIVNTSVILFSEIFHDNFFLFLSSFGFSLGPILQAIFIYKWGFVFHNSIKFTSLWTHFSPGISMFISRWYDQKILETANLFLFGKTKIFINFTNGLDFSNFTLINLDCFFDFFIYCAKLYLPWFVIYYFLIFHVFYSFNNKNGYETQYNYLMQNKKDRKYLMIFGEKYSGLAFMFLHIRYVALTLLISFLILYSFYFGLLILIACIFSSIWVTSTYYIEYFSQKYMMQFSFDNNFKKLTPV